VLLTACLDAWRDIGRQKDRHQMVSLNKPDPEYEEMRESKLRILEARIHTLEESLMAKTRQIDAVLDNQAELERVVQNKEAELARLKEESHKFQSELKKFQEPREEVNRESFSGEELKKCREYILQLEEEGHRNKMNFLEAKREMAEKDKKIEELEEMAKKNEKIEELEGQRESVENKEEMAEKDKKIEELEKQCERAKEKEEMAEKNSKRMEEEISRLQMKPESENEAKDMAYNCSITSLQTYVRQLTRHLEAAEEDIFISRLSLKNKTQSRNFFEELKVTREELDALSAQLVATEHMSPRIVEKAQLALTLAQRDLNLLNQLLFQNQSQHLKIDRVESENSALKSRLGAMDVGYEELLAEVAILSPSPQKPAAKECKSAAKDWDFKSVPKDCKSAAKDWECKSAAKDGKFTAKDWDYKSEAKDWDCKSAAKAYSLITRNGGKCGFKEVRLEEKWVALQRDMRQTMQAEIVAVHDVQRDPGLQQAFDLLTKPAYTTLYWGAGPNIDPLRADLMFWFLTQPWGSNALDAHRLGAYRDGERYRLVVLKVQESNCFDPFTCVPFAVVTYTSPIEPGDPHRLATLRSETCNEERLDQYLQRIALTMGMHGVNLAMAMAVFVTPQVSYLAQDVWKRCKEKALKNVLSGPNIVMDGKLLQN